MAMFKNELKNYKKPDEPLHKMPKSLQELIDIEKVAENGIFQLSPTRFSKTYKFRDINYSTLDYEEKARKFEKYCRLLNSIDCRFKITIANQQKDMDSLETQVLMDNKNDGLNMYRDAFNEAVLFRINEGSHGLERMRYLTLTVERKTYEAARERFKMMEEPLGKRFKELGSELTPLSTNERIDLLHRFLDPDSETSGFDVRTAIKRGRDFKNDLVGGDIRFFADHMMIGKSYARALFIRRFVESKNSDEFFREFTTLPIRAITTIDVVPVPKDLTNKILKNKYIGVENNIIKQQRVRNKNRDFASDISYMTQVEKEEIAIMMDNVREHDENLFYAGITMLIVCNTKEELDIMTESIRDMAKAKEFTVDTHTLKQREALNSVLPIGVRQIGTMRTFFTHPLASFVPFSVLEVDDKEGFFYGINRISKNLIIINRTIHMNGNAFVFGITGSGKSFFVKLEVIQALLKTNHFVMIIDPMNEYFGLAEALGGVVINLSNNTNSFVNPLDVDIASLNVKELNRVIGEKIDFLISMCDHLLDGNLNAIHRSIIERATRDMYEEAYRTGEVPLMSNFIDCLLKIDRPEAEGLAFALDAFNGGSLSIFNHPTNVDMDNRLIVFGIQDLGESLISVGMLVMLEAIQSKIKENFKKGIVTRINIDECHVLLNNNYSAAYLNGLWKKVRKQGGLLTGISQNINDLMHSPMASSLISNSDMIVLLKQSEIDAEAVTRTVGITEEQLEDVKDTPVGTGLLKIGSAIVPFDNTLANDNMIYDLINTNIHEKIRTGKFVYEEPEKKPEPKPPKPRTVNKSTSDGWLI